MQDANQQVEEEEARNSSNWSSGQKGADLKIYLIDQEVVGEGLLNAIEPDMRNAPDGLCGETSVIQSISDLPSSRANEQFEGGDQSNSNQENAGGIHGLGHPSPSNNHFSVDHQLQDSGYQGTQDGGHYHPQANLQADNESIEIKHLLQQEMMDSVDKNSSKQQQQSRQNDDQNECQVKASRTLNFGNTSDSLDQQQLSTLVKQDKRLSIKSLKSHQSDNEFAHTGAQNSKNVKIYQMMSPKVYNVPAGGGSSQIQSIKPSGTSNAEHLAIQEGNQQHFQDPHKLTSIASFGQIQHQRINSLNNSNQHQEAINDYDDSQRDLSSNIDQQLRGTQSSGKRESKQRLQSILGTANGQNSDNMSQNALMKLGNINDMSSDLTPSKTQDVQPVATISKLGSLPGSSRIAIKMSGNVQRQKNFKQFGQATERNTMTSLNSQQVLEIQQNMNQLGTRRNSRVNSQGFNEQAMAAIEAANSTFQRNNAIGVSPDDQQSPDKQPQKKGPISPTKLKLTLKGDKFIQKIQKHRDEGIDYQFQRSNRQGFSNENTERNHNNQKNELILSKRQSQRGQTTQIGASDELSATPISPQSNHNTNDICDLSAKKLGYDGQLLNLNQPIIQKLGTNKIVSAKRAGETQSKSNNFAPIISKEQIKFHKNATTNREIEKSGGNSNNDQAQLNGGNSSANDTSVSARLNSSNQYLNTNQSKSGSIIVNQDQSEAQKVTSLPIKQFQPISSSENEGVVGVSNLNLNKITVNKKGVQKQTSSNTTQLLPGGDSGIGNNGQIIIGQSLLSKRSQQNNQNVHNFTLRSHSSQNSGGNGFGQSNGPQVVMGSSGMMQNQIGGALSSYRGDSNRMLKNIHKMSPDVKGITSIINEHQQDPYAFYIMNQNKVKQSSTQVNTPVVQSNGVTHLNTSSVSAQPNFQINVKNSSQNNNDLNLKKLGAQMINSADDPSQNNQMIQNKFEETNQNHFEMGVKSCRPNLYNKHRLIISQRGGVAPYQLALLTNGNNMPGTNEGILSGHNQFMGSNVVPLCGGVIPHIESGSRDISNVNSQSTGPRRNENNTRQQSLEKHILMMQEMQASGRTAAVGGTQQFINIKGHPQVSGIPISSSHQQKSFDLHDSNKKNVQRHQYKHMMSPGGGTVFVQGHDQPLYRRIDDRQILSGAVDGRNRGFHNLMNNYQENYYQNQSLTSNNERLNAKGKGGFVKFSGSGSHGSNFNSSVSTFPAAPIQKLSDVKNPQKLLTFRFVNRKMTKISEIQMFKNLRELDLTGNMLQEVKELNSLNFLKNLNLSYNKIQQLWMLPKRIEILNLAHNQIKTMPEEVCKNLKNVTTIDVSNNKLESLGNFQFMHRIKRLVAKHNFIRQIATIKSIENIYELDLEGNAVDSHNDFLEFIKGKNDIIVMNLHLNPIMVEVDSIEKINEDLISKAPDKISRKTKEEIEEFKEIMGINKDAGNLSDVPATPHSINNKSQSNSVDGLVTNVNNNSGALMKRTSGIHSTPGNDNENSNRKGAANLAGDETNRFYNKLHLIKELADCLTYLKNGVLYRNKRVFNKIKQIQQQTKRSISNYSNSSHSAAAINQSLHYQQSMSQNNAAGTTTSGVGQNAIGSGRNNQNGSRSKPSTSNEGRSGGRQERDGSSQGKHNLQNKLSPINTHGKNAPKSGENNNIPRPQAANPMTGKVYAQKNNLSNSVGYSPIVSKKSHRYEDIENLYDYIVEQEELKRLKQQKIFAKRRKQKRKQLMSQIGPSGVNNSELVDGSPSQNQSQYPQQFQQESSDENNSSDDFTDDDIDDDDDDYLDDLENSRDMNFVDQQKLAALMISGNQSQEDMERIALLKAGRLPSAEVEEMQRYFMHRNGADVGMNESSCIIAGGQNSSRLLENSYYMQNYGQYHQNLHDDDAVSQTITSDLEADINSYPYKKVDMQLELDALYDQNNEQNYQQNGSQIDDNDYLNGSTAGFGKKLREINREINQEHLDSLDEKGHHPNGQLNSKGVLIIKDSQRSENPKGSMHTPSHSHQSKLLSQSAQKAKILNLNAVSTTTGTNKTKQKLNLNLSKITIDQQQQQQQQNQNIKGSPQRQGKVADSIVDPLNAQHSVKHSQMDDKQDHQQIDTTSKKENGKEKSSIKLQQKLPLVHDHDQMQQDTPSAQASKDKMDVGGGMEQLRDGIKSELKIDQRIIDELNINRKKQIKTVQNSNESSQESDSQVCSVDQLGLKIGKGLLKGTNSKNEIGICTITNSNSDKHTTGANQQQLNQSFSLKNIQLTGDANQQYEVESLIMQIRQKDPQAMHNEFSAKNENYAAAYNMLMVAGQNIPFHSLRNGEGLAGLSNINSQKYNSIMQASLSQNIDAPDFLKIPSNPNLLDGNKGVVQSEQQSHALLDDSMAQSGLSFTQNSKKNIHPHFKLDLSKCIDYNDDYMDENSANCSSDQKPGSNFLDEIQQPSQQKDDPLLSNESSVQINPDQINLTEINLDNIENVKIEISKQDCKTKKEPSQKNIQSANMKSLRDKIRESSRRSQGGSHVADKQKVAKDQVDVNKESSNRQENSKRQNNSSVTNQKSPKKIKKFNLSKDYYQQKETIPLPVDIQAKNGYQITVASQGVQRNNMTERDNKLAVSQSKLDDTQDGENSESINNQLKPPLEEGNLNKVRTERQTKTPGQVIKTKGLIQLSNKKNNGKNEILLQIPQSKIQRYNIENGNKLILPPSSELDNTDTPKMGGSSSVNACNDCQIYQKIIQSLKQNHQEQLIHAREVAQCYRQQLLDIKENLCINGELQDLFEHEHAKSAGNRQIRVNQFSSIVQQFFQKFSQELAKLERENNKLEQMCVQMVQRDMKQDQQKQDLLQINKNQLKEVVNQKTRQSIKIPNIAKMDQSRTGKLMSNANMSLSSNSGGSRLPYAPKTITSRQSNKRKSLERSGQGTSVAEKHEVPSRNQFQRIQNSNHMGDQSTIEGFNNEKHQYSMQKENPNHSEGQRVQRKQSSLNPANAAMAMNVSYTQGQVMYQPDVDQMNFELGDRVQLQELEEGDSIAQYVVAQLQNRNSDALDIKDDNMTNKNTLEPPEKSNSIIAENMANNSHLVSIENFDRMMGQQHSQNTSQLQNQVQNNAGMGGAQKMIQLTNKGEREYEQNTFSLHSNNNITKLYTNRNIRENHLITHQNSLSGSGNPKHLRQRGTNAGISGRHGGTVEDSRSAQPPILSQQTSLQTSSVQLNDKKIIIQKQNMLQQNLSVNTNIEAVASSSFNVANNNNTMNVSMIVGGNQKGGYNKKIKSQRACHAKLLQQHVNNYTGGNIISELNNLQLIQQQLMRNKSNTSRGTKGSQQYREQFLNLNQTSQSSINPQNYLTAKRKSPKIAQKLKVQVQKQGQQQQNIQLDEQQMQQLHAIQQMYMQQQQSSNMHQMSGSGQLQNMIISNEQMMQMYPDNNYNIETIAALQQQQMAQQNQAGVAMTYVDPRIGTMEVGGINMLKTKKTPSVNSRTAKENWKSLQQSAQQVQSMDFSGKTGKKVSKIVDNQKSLERIVAYQSSGTQYKTSRLPMSNQRMIEQNETSINTSGAGPQAGFHRNEVFLSQPQQNKKSQSHYQANRDNRVNSGSIGPTSKMPNSGKANSKSRINISSMGPTAKQNHRQSIGDQRSILGSDNNNLVGQPSDFDLDPSGNMIGGTQERRQRMLDTSLNGATPQIPDDTTFGYNGSCEVKLHAQNLEHIQPSYYTQRKLLNPKPTPKAPMPGNSTANASSSQSKNILLNLQNQKQGSLQQQNQYSQQKQSNQQNQIHVMKQKNKFLETRSKSIQRNLDGRQVIASGYSQLLDHIPNFNGPDGIMPNNGGAQTGGPGSNIATGGQQSRQKLSNLCSNAQVQFHQMSTDGVNNSKLIQDANVKFNMPSSQNNNNSNNLRGQTYNLFINSKNSEVVMPTSSAGIQMLNQYQQQQQQQTSGGSRANSKGRQANHHNLNLLHGQESLESTSANKRQMGGGGGQNDIVIYSAHSGKRPQSVVEIGGRRFQKGVGHPQGSIQQKGGMVGGWPHLMPKGAFTNTHGDGVGLVPGGPSKKERKGRGKSSDQKNTKSLGHNNKGLKQLQAKNSLNTTDMNQFNFFDMSKNIEQNIQKIQQIQNAKQQQIIQRTQMSSNRDSDVNIKQQVQLMQQHQNSLRTQSIQSPHHDRSNLE